MKRMIGLLLALLLLVPVCALAELRRGDSGEEVTALQQMLWDTGSSLKRAGRRVRQKYRKGRKVVPGIREP